MVYAENMTELKFKVLTSSCRLRQGRGREGWGGERRREAALQMEPRALQPRQGRGRHHQWIWDGLARLALISLGARLHKNGGKWPLGRHLLKDGNDFLGSREVMVRDALGSSV